MLKDNPSKGWNSVLKLGLIYTTSQKSEINIHVGVLYRRYWKHFTQSTVTSAHSMVLLTSSHICIWQHVCSDKAPRGACLLLLLVYGPAELLWGSIHIHAHCFSIYRKVMDNNDTIHVEIDGDVQTDMTTPTARMRNWTENPARASFANQDWIQGTIQPLACGDRIISI